MLVRSSYSWVADLCSSTLWCDRWLESKHCPTSWIVSEELADRENQRHTADVMLVYTHPALRNALPCIASPMCTAVGALSGSALLRPWQPYDTIPLHLPHHLTCQGQSDSKVLESLMSVKGCGIGVSLIEHVMNGNKRLSSFLLNDPILCSQQYNALNSTHSGL